jgi:hypothetical protein
MDQQHLFGCGDIYNLNKEKGMQYLSVEKSLSAAFVSTTIIRTAL